MIVSHSSLISVVYFDILIEVVIEFTYNATVCSPVNIVEAIQTVTEFTVDESISCAEASSDCIVYESDIVISSSLLGK